MGAHSCIACDADREKGAFCKKHYKEHKSSKYVKAFFKQQKEIKKSSS